MLRNKKILTLFLVVMFVFALGSTAFAGYGKDYQFSNIQPGEERVVRTLSSSEVQSGNVFIGTVDVEGSNLKYKIVLKGSDYSKVSSDYFTTSSGMHYFGQALRGNNSYEIRIKNKGTSPISGQLILVVD